VRTQLLSSDQVKSSNVKVTTENGEVFLLGLVTDREGRAAADIASRVSGVKHVTTAFTISNKLLTSPVAHRGESVKTMPAFR
jgi:osmotically-inducible protein OsmY